MGKAPEYAVVYITRTAREIRYVAEVKEVVPAEEANLAKSLDEYTSDKAEFELWKLKEATITDGLF